MTAHDKKRLGHHHKVSKHYAKTYWPYLPMLLIVVVGIVLNTMWSTSSAVLSYATEMSIASLLQETNAQRAQNGRSALALNNQLNQAAQAKANDMATRNYWSHTTPDGKQPWQFIADAGYSYSTAGENLAYGFATSADTVAGWMNSSGHRANLLNTDYRDVGFGVANAANYQSSGEQTIVVAMYAAPLPVAAPVTPAPAQPQPRTATPAQRGQTQPTSSTPQEQPQPAPNNAEPSLPENTKPVPVKTPVRTAANPSKTEPVDLTSRQVTRVNVLTAGNAEWAVLAASVLVTIGALSLVYRHGKMWRKFIARGEHFVIRHPFLDTLIVGATVAGFLLSRTVGFIH